MPYTHLFDQGPGSRLFRGQEVTIRDSDGDGDYDADDLEESGLRPGSQEAKKAWYAIEAKALKAGLYKGKPLVPGEAGEGQGDFELLKDRARWTRGLSEERSAEVAGRVRSNLGY